MVMDLKYYSEVSIFSAKKLNADNVIKDYHFSEKFETLKQVEEKFKSKKIYYSKAFSSFIIIFRCNTDEKDVYTFLGKIKKGYKGIQLYLDVEYNKDEDLLEYILKIEYDFK